MRLSKLFLKTTLGLFVSHLAMASVPSNVTDGPRLQSREALFKELFPTMTRVEESSMLPEQFGGTSLLGLVNRLLGEAISKDHEGLQVRRFTYTSFEKQKVLGLCHGSGRELSPTQVIQVFVCYTPDGKIMRVWIEGLAEEQQKALPADAWEPFKGYQVQEFEVRRGKKGRVRGYGRALTELRNPKNKKVDDKLWSAVLRAVKFNAAFMDVSYFITQHPDLSSHGRLEADVDDSAPEAQFEVKEGAKNGSPK